MSEDPRDWFDGRARVLFVHAHPDDETITTGGTLAALAEAGREPLLVTLTRGERGEVVAGPLAALAGAHGLAVVRQNELRTALGMLGLERHAFLGAPPARAAGLPPAIYEDSGMRWGSDGRAEADGAAGADALTSAPAVEVIADLLAAADAAGAGAIVSYDDGGGYGHPDHVLAHRASRAVALALGLPFWEILGRAEAAAATAGDDPDPRHLRAEAHDVSPWLDRKTAALRAHGTQLVVDGADLVHVGGQRESIGTTEAFALRAAPQAGD
ncbi:PIG-L family deacetylase [Leucobacter allii]|uniref:PIG-L family deacetylase n=1 Tax=Leucobacter allii TaxID=2932247 RepID=A0ABY4FLE3_9MICO|nr:PIG-L family deacetylase [Leucobacter allii]UOQ57076.1 PIG-L family deacetylase [Leucobacter allii]